MYTRDELKAAILETITMAYESRGYHVPGKPKYKYGYSKLSARWNKTCAKFGGLDKVIKEMVDEGLIVIEHDESKRTVHLPVKLSAEELAARESAFIAEMRAKGLLVEEGEESPRAVAQPRKTHIEEINEYIEKNKKRISQEAESL